jgi:hypothetical protein
MRFLHSVAVAPHFRTKCGRLLRDSPSDAHNMSTLAHMMGENEASIHTSSYDRFDGNIPEDRGASFSDRNLYFGRGHTWLASYILDSD